MTIPEQDPVLLEVKNLGAALSTRRGVLKAVDNVSFSLDRGKTLGMVGESGCGKTMLARAIMGLLPRNARVPSRARVKFRGTDLLGLKKNARRKLMGMKIALVFQDPMTSLNPVMKIGKQVAEAMEYHLNMEGRTARRRAVELLELVGVPMAGQRAGQYPHQLSGGLRQRVAIAAALACEPELLIADEPTTALDVTVQAEILDLLARFQQKKNMAMILITHDFGVVAGRTHETAVMYAGKIVEQAPTSHLFHHMGMPYTRALMDAVPRLSNPPHTRLRAIEGRPPDLTEPPSGCPFEPRCHIKKPRCGQKTPGLMPMNEPWHQVACWYPLNDNGP